MTTTALAPALSELVTAPFTALVGTAMTLHSMGLPYSSRLVVELLPQVLAPGGVHRHYLAFESPLDQIGDDRVAHLAGGHRGPHHGYGLGIEEKLKHQSFTSSQNESNNQQQVVKGSVGANRASQVGCEREE